MTVDAPERILVCGSRDWDDRRIIRQILLALRDPWNNKQTVIHGDALGADTLAHDVARELGYRIEPYPADWGTYGRAAGPVRNAKMLREGKPDIVYAFHDDLRASKGTRDMVKRAKKEKIPVYVIGHG